MVVIGELESRLVGLTWEVKGEDRAKDKLQLLAERKYRLCCGGHSAS